MQFHSAAFHLVFALLIYASFAAAATSAEVDVTFAWSEFDVTTCISEMREDLTIARPIRLQSADGDQRSLAIKRLRVHAERHGQALFSCEADFSAFQRPARTSMNIGDHALELRSELHILETGEFVLKLSPRVTTQVGAAHRIQAPQFDIQVQVDRTERMSLVTHQHALRDNGVRMEDKLLFIEIVVSPIKVHRVPEPIADTEERHGRQMRSAISPTRRRFLRR